MTTIFFSALTFALVTLKLTGYIAWAWAWVLAPIWVPILVLAALLVWAHWE